MKVIIAACLFAVAIAAPQNYYQGQYRQPQYQGQYQQPTYSTSGKAVVPIVSESNEINPDGSFSYSYVSGDGQQAQAQGYLKNAGNKDAEAETIQGSYSYTAPDGTPISVTYIADENGYRAEGAHIPTPPPVPEAIQRALAYIAQTQRSNPQSTYQEPTQYRQPSTFTNQYNRPRPFGSFF